MILQFLLYIFLQPIVFVVYPFFIFWHRIFFKKNGVEFYLKKIPIKSYQSIAPKNIHKIGIRDNNWLNNSDDHCTMTHVFLWDLHPNMEMHHSLVAKDGRLKRMSPKDHGNPTSGDCIVFWCWSFVVNKSRDFMALRRLVDHYILNRFALQHPSGKGVNTTSSNGGVRWTVDGDFLNLGPMCFGPQYYTTAALLALAASQLGDTKYKILYWVHYLLFGGWLWKWLPVAPLYRVHYSSFDVVERALWVIRKSGFKAPQEAIPGGKTKMPNPFFEALHDKPNPLAREMLLRMKSLHPQAEPSDASYMNTHSKETWTVLCRDWALREIDKKVN